MIYMKKPEAKYEGIAQKLLDGRMKPQDGLHHVAGKGPQEARMIHNAEQGFISKQMNKKKLI